jgi:protein-S-isoprenylcysteine O-methyltransferase Ste14
MKRFAFLSYGAACYGLFLLTFGYLAGFVGGVGVPKSIDGPPGATAPATAAIDGLLLALFAVQHSLMARPAFKRWWTRYLPAPLERSTYVLASCLATGLLVVGWQPIPFVIWDVHPPWGRRLVWALFAAGWLAVPLVSLMIHHGDLFGIRQVWLYFSGRPYTPLPFKTPLAYRLVRHPLYLGWALAFWATPTMTTGHLLFAGVLTLYMGLASVVEERDLVAHFGEAYVHYQRQVPRFVPRLFSFCAAGTVRGGR